jgi:hypothetical protein
MTILQNIRNVSKAVIDDEAIGESLKNAAIKAVLGGVGSQDWEIYMRIFADNTEQLNRLTRREEPLPANWDGESVAYLVSNAICGGASTGELRQFIKPSLDEGLSTQTEQGFVKTPFQ